MLYYIHKTNVGGINLQNYKLTIEYEGTRYNGWQRQGNTENTIQGVIEAAIKKVFNEDAEVVGSGRTDAGVHALGQVANFKMNKFAENDVIRSALNRALPSDIRITECERVDERFHSRLNAKAKTYTYKLFTGEKADVFSRRTVLHYPAKLDVEEMKKAAAYLVGMHDFKAFSSNRRTKKSTVRELYSVDITQDNDYVSISFRGNGFLYNMSRILTGTLVEVGTGKRKCTEINEIFAGADRSNAGTTMPARGLTLVSVEYD
jgi:tRNA pseudouridine38-40 synthase